METLLLVIHYIGIISFSVAGAMVAIDHETDCIGVVLLSVITCFGGGLLRDVTAGQAIGREIPALFTDLKVELLVSVITGLLVFFVAFIFKKHYVREEETVNKINNVFDALGIGVFSAAGTGDYLAAGPLVAITMGILSSVGGSILRDIMLRDVPFVLCKRIYMLALLSGSAVYYLVAAVIMPDQESTRVVATLACTGVIFAIRMCATAFKWNMPKAINFAKLRAEMVDGSKEET